MRRLPEPEVTRQPRLEEKRRRRPASRSVSPAPQTLTRTKCSLSEAGQLQPEAELQARWPCPTLPRCTTNRATTARAATDAPPIPRKPALSDVEGQSKASGAARIVSRSRPNPGARNGNVNPPRLRVTGTARFRSSLGLSPPALVALVPLR